MHCFVFFLRNQIWKKKIERGEYRISIYATDQSTGGTFPSTQLLVGVLVVVMNTKFIRFFFLSSLLFSSRIFPLMNSLMNAALGPFFSLPLLFINRQSVINEDHSRERGRKKGRSEECPSLNTRHWLYYTSNICVTLFSSLLQT